MPYLQPYRRVIIIPLIRNENSPLRITTHPQGRPANSSVTVSKFIPEAYGTDIRTDPHTSTSTQNSEVSAVAGGPKSGKHVKPESAPHNVTSPHQQQIGGKMMY
jgi:hypothetical protein